METKEIVAAIRKGEFDREQLNEIVRAVRARRAFEQEERSFEMKRAVHEGDVITMRRLTGRGAVLNGKIATVRWVSLKTVTVNLPDEAAYGVWAGADKVRIPMSCIEVPA